MKTGAIALASTIALFCVYQALLAPSPWWALIQVTLAGVAAAALLTDFVILAASCALVLLLISLITFFSVGFYVLLPAAALVILIALHSQRQPT